MKLCFLSVLCVISLHGLVYGQDQGLADSEGSGSDLSGSGMSSGDGSGDVGCIEPQYRPPPPEETEREVLTEMRCHLACVEKVASTVNGSIELDRTYPMWPTLPNDLFSENCTIYQMIQECRTGCMEHGRSAEATVTRCASLCSRQCLLECDRQLSCGQTGSQCQRVCSLEYCQVGCQLYEDVIEQGPPNNTYLPQAPREAPRLLLPDDPRPSVYRVKFSNTMQDITSPQATVPIATTFMFRILHPGRNIVAYYWLPSLDDLLDLVTFACDEDVLIQYAAVNKHGATRLSTATIMDVYGVLVPTDLLPQNPDPDSITFTVSPDLRPKFWKHALIQVSWQLPPAVDTLSHFVVTLRGHTPPCGSRDHKIVVSKDETSAVLEARSPHDGPVGGCDYKVSVSSLSTNGAYIPEGRRHTISVNKQKVIPVPLNFQCEREWDQEQGTFQFHVSWSIPDSEYLRDAIRHFRVQTTLISMETNDYITADIPYETDQTDYSYTTDELLFGSAGSYYRLTMETTSSHTNMILIPDLRECQFDALPLPPSVIDDITITSDDITVVEVKEDLLGGSVGVVRAWVEWGRPDGGEGVYDVRVTENPAVEGADRGEEFTFQQFNVTDDSVRVPVLMELPAYVENTCVYFQVRSKSVFDAVSNWSSPVCISIGRLHLTTTTEEEPTMNPTAIPGLSLEVLYIIIGLGVLMLVAVVIMAVCVLVACVKNRRYRKRTAVYLESNGSLKDSLDIKPLKGDNFHMIPLVNEDSWELHPQDVVIETKLGHGAFGDVYQGLLKTEADRDETDGPAEMTNVAIKLLKSSSGELERQSFLDHIEQTKLVSQQSLNAGKPGTHVVRMIGCVTTKEPYCLLTELPAKGDLLTYLQHQRGLIVEGAKHVEVTSRGLVKFTEQIAVGMELLSSIGVVHGDLACRNMYLDNNLHLKISDFGLSGSSKQKAKPRAYHRTIDGRLPMRWMAMESLEEGLFSTASDVWGFGVTVWEIASLGGFPYSTVSHKELVAHLEIGERLEKPPNCSRELYNLMSGCWAEETLERPSFTELRETIQQLQAQETPPDLLTLDIDPKLPYYNVVLASSQSNTPEHSATATGGSKGGDGSAGNYWQRRDKVGDRSYPVTNQILPSIVEDEQEDLDQLQSLEGYLEEKTRPSTHTKQTIVVEMYENDNGSTGSENIVVENLSESPETGTTDLESGSLSPETASSDLGSTSPNLSEELNSQVTEKCDLSITNGNIANNLSGVSHDNQVICEEIEPCPSSTDL